MKALKLTTIGLVVVVAATSLALAFGIPAGFLVDIIQDRVESESGYRLRIAGDVKIGMWPSPALAVRDVAVMDKDDIAPQVRMLAEDVRVGISIASLFTSRTRLTEVTVTRPVFRIPVTRGRTTTTTLASVRQAVRRTDPGQAITIDRIRVRNGTMLMLSSGNRTEGRIDSIEIDGTVRADDTFELNGAGRSDGEPLRLQLKGKAAGGRFEGSPIPLEFMFEAPGLLQDPLAGSAELTTSGSVLQVKALSGTFGKNRFDGWASADFTGKPLVKMEVEFQRVALTAARPDTTPRAEATSDIDQPWSDQHINFDGLNFFDAEMQISATELNLDVFRFAPFSLKASLTNGLLSAGFAQVGIYGGQAGGALVLDAAGVQPSHALRLELNGVRALPLLSDVAGFNSIDGRMQANIDVRARGLSPRSIMSSLDGAVEILITDGEIRNVNIAQMIRSLTSNALSGWQQGRNDKTDLTQLSALFRLEKGRATTDTLRLAGPLVRVTGTGTVDLGAKTLLMRLDPKLVMSLEGQGSTAADPVGFGVPVMMQGRWAQPRIYLDMAGMLDNPDGAYAKLRELGGGLFGGGAGSGMGGSLMQGLGTLLERLGKDPKDALPSILAPPAASVTPPAASPLPAPRAPATTTLPPPSSLTPPSAPPAATTTLPPPSTPPAGGGRLPPPSLAPSQAQPQPAPAPQPAQPLPPPQAQPSQPQKDPPTRQEIEGQIRDILRDLLK